ncbi:MAG: fatty acyl-AMP ligase [Planctomycetes bacterium]|nr:fatty acyl-AMP ligase [Planctomycetota bacterium]
MTLDLRFQTLTDVLDFDSKASAPVRGVTFIDDDGTESVVPYLLVKEEAAARAGALQRRGVARGELVMLLLPTTPDFLYVYFGLLLGGAVPVPLALPSGLGSGEDFTRRTARLATYLGARRLVTTVRMRDTLVASVGGAALEGLDTILAHELRQEARAGGTAFQVVAVGPGDPALVQCTSGSTGQPKGAVLTHGNLVSNVYQIGWSLKVTPEDVSVCWLPLYHDMGLIGCLLFSLYWGLDAVFMSPYRFMKNPATWLRAVADHRGSISPAPNFAYAYTAERARDRHLEGLDLSCWRSALCGAEPISARVLAAFTRRFRPYGLPESACQPCYGLAEATLAVSFHESGRPYRTDRISRSALVGRAVAEVVPRDEPDALEVVNLGRPMPETRVRVVGEEGAPLPEGGVGGIQVSGPTVMRGYHALPELTREVLRDGWLDTGDLGYLRDGELRVTGRSKDIIVIRGRKFLPTDFEWAVEDLDGVRKGNVVAFGHWDPSGAGEGLYLVCETDLPEGPAREGLGREVRRRVAEVTGVTPAVVALVGRNTICRTSSGKLQRGLTRRRFLERTS